MGLLLPELLGASTVGPSYSGTSGVNGNGPFNFSFDAAGNMWLGLAIPYAPSVAVVNPGSAQIASYANANGAAFDTLGNAWVVGPTLSIYSKTSSPS